jgi:hypothetical protein
MDPWILLLGSVYGRPTCSGFRTISPLTSWFWSPQEEPSPGPGPQSLGGSSWTSDVQ